MSADLKAQLDISADASGVEAGVKKAKQSLESLGVKAKAAGKDAAEGIDAIGKGGETAAKKVDRATSTMISSIQRTTAALDAGGRSSSKYFEVLAGQRGVDTKALKPYLDQLDAVSAKQAVAGNALKAGGIQFDKFGLSARQTTAALRQVPAQFTDIITSLQGGQAPLTVLLQQGGQLKDVFGGVGPAARALGGYVLGLVNPFTLAAGAVAALGLAYFEGSKEADAFAKALIMSGNGAGTSVSQLTAMAQRIDAITGTQASASAALAEFASTGQIAGQQLERFTLIALKMEKETGQAVKETVKQFAELGNSPVEAAAKLNESTNFLTTSIFKQIRALDEQGRSADAAALAQKAYADALDARLGQINSRLGLIERGWRGITGAAKDAWDAMLNVGRGDTLGEQLAAAQNTLAERQQRGSLNPTTTAAFEKGNEALRQRIAFLSESVRVESRSGEAAKAAAEQAKAYVQFSRDGDKFLSDRARTEKAVAEARILGAKAGLSQLEIDKRVADIRAKDKGGISAGLQIDKAQLGLDVESIKNASEQLIGTYTNSERILESLRSAGLVSDKQYYESKRGFLNLETQAKEDALQREVARYQQEKLSGKDKLENEKKIADTTSKLAILRADASSKLVVLANQEAAANAKLELSYLSARQAAQDYFDSLTRQQDRDLSGVGQGAQKRNFNSGISQIEDRYSGQRRDLENQRAQLELEGKFTDEARQQYQQRLSIINEFQAKSIDSYRSYYDKLMVQQGDWSLGASEGLQNYLDQSKNVFKQTEDLVTGAFKGMEDALVGFVTTGKLDFKSLAQSIIADIARIIIKQQISNALGVAGNKGGSGGSGGFGGFIAGLFGSGGGGESMIGNMGAESIIPGFDGGGFTGVGARTGGVDGKGGFPAILHPNETVIDHTRGQSASGSVSVQVNVDASGSKVQGENDKSDQLGKRIGAVIRQVLVEEKMPGGILA